MRILFFAAHAFMQISRRVMHSMIRTTIQEGKGKIIQRLRGIDIRLSDFPTSIGLCQSDSVSVFNALNAVQQRLLYCKEAGEESWWGTWAEILFVVSRTRPYATFDRDVARLEAVDICDTPITVNNQFAEYLRFGNGRFPKIFRQGHCGCFTPEAYSRNNVPTWIDLVPGSYVQALATDAQDLGKRVLMQGTDTNDVKLISQDGFSRVEGLFESLTSPFVQWPTAFNTLTGIQKDVTAGPVHIYGVDPATAATTLLVTMQPQETTAWYRRYYFNGLPFNCCSSTGPNPCLTGQPIPESVTVTALAKLEFIPVTTDTDYCLIQNLQALVEEGMSWRYSKMDSIQSKQLEQIKHKNAVRLLNGEIAHYLGIQDPAVDLAIFGSARLGRQNIGLQI